MLDNASKKQLEGFISALHRHVASLLRHMVESVVGYHTKICSDSIFGTNSHKIEEEVSKKVDMFANMLIRSAQQCNEEKREGNRKGPTSSSEHEGPKTPDPKAYVQQLESSRIKLTQLEQELQRARAQGVFFSGGALMANQGLQVGMSNQSQGMWKTPAECCFLWMGEFKPSEIIKAANTSVVTKGSRLLYVAECYVVTCNVV